MRVAVLILMLSTMVLYSLALGVRLGEISKNRRGVERLLRIGGSIALMTGAILGLIKLYYS